MTHPVRQLEERPAQVLCEPEQMWLLAVRLSAMRLSAMPLSLRHQVIGEDGDSPAEASCLSEFAANDHEVGCAVRPCL